MGDAADPRATWPRWSIALVCLAVLMAAYGPSLRGDFLMSDRDALVTNLKLVGPAGLASIWLPDAADGFAPLDQYQPLTYTSFWLERQVWGLRPAGYRAINLLLHALNSLLVWQLLRRLGVRGAALAAAIFALHPVNVESVAWIYERKNVLSGLFYLLALLAWEDGRRGSRYAASLALFGAALLSKTSTVMLPVVVIGIGWARREAWSWARARRIAPFFAMAGAMALVTVGYETSVTGASGGAYAAAPLERALRAGWVVAFHAAKVLVPAKLAFFYPSPPVEPNTWVAALPDLVLVALVAILVWRRNGWGRTPLLAVGYYLVMMFPVLGFFDIFYHRFSLMADHFQYLATIGLIAGVVHAAVGWLERAGHVAPGTGIRGQPLLARVAAVAVVGVFFALTWQRSHAFTNDGALALDSAAKYPDSWIAHQKSGEYFLGLATRNPARAMPLAWQAAEHLERAQVLRPGHPQVNDSLGVAYALGGRSDDARRQLRRAIDADPDNASYRVNLARVLENAARPEAAFAEYRAAVRAAPERPRVRILFAQALFRAGRYREATVELELAEAQASRSKPGDPRAASVAKQAAELRREIAARQTTGP
ncbi:MAG: tetratricopeptide repeat protein [Myxococcota bacterium]